MALAGPESHTKHTSDWYNFWGTPLFRHVGGLGVCAGDPKTAMISDNGRAIITFDVVLDASKPSKYRGINPLGVLETAIVAGFSVDWPDLDMENFIGNQDFNLTAFHAVLEKHG